MSDPGEDDLPHDLILLLTPASDIYHRIEPAKLIGFVALVVRVVDAHFGRSPQGECVEVDVACGLVPGGKLLVEVQTRPPAEGSATIGKLVDAVKGLPIPEVVQGPVAFTRRNVFGNASTPPGGFGLPFVRYAHGSRPALLDDILMDAAGGTVPRKSIWAKLSELVRGTPSAQRTIAEQDIIPQLAREIGIPVIACNGRVAIG